MLTVAERDELTNLVIDQLAATLKVTDATPTAARQTIKAEVLSLIQSGKDIQTTDVVKLENRIKAKLSGSSSSYTELTSPIREKLEQNKNDEWATLAALAAVKEKEDKAKQAQQNKERKLAAQEELKIHEQELKMKKKMAKEAKKKELLAMNASVTEWRSKEVARRSEQNNKMKAVKTEREAQLTEQQRRNNLATSLRRIIELQAAAANASALATAAETERKAKAQGRAQLKQFLLSNDAFKAEREARKAAEAEADIKLMKEYAATLERQEQQRKEQLEKIKAVQAQQAEEAATRPEFKRWMSEEVIEKQLRKHEEKTAEEEKAKAATLAESNAQFKQGVEQQVEEKKQKEATKREEIQKERQNIEVAVKQAAVEDKAKKGKENEKKKSAKKALDDQVQREKVMAAKRGAMTEVEKKLNAGLLKEAAACGLKKKK